MSIKLTAAIYSVTAILLLTIVVMFIGYYFYKKNVNANYEKYTTTVLDNAYNITEDFAFGDMIANREMPEAYEKMRERLNRVKENSDIEYLYAIYFDDINDIHSLTYAINTKTQEELKNGSTYTYLGTPCEEGSFEDETLYILQDAVKKGQKESGILKGDSSVYKYMLNGYKVIFDSKGDPAGLLCVEIKVDKINNEGYRYLWNTSIFVALFTIVLIAIYLTKIERGIIYPITGITNAADNFAKNIGNPDAMDENARKLEKLEISSDNEIGNLYRSVNKMETGIAKQFREISQYNESILKMQAGLMALLEDLVEVRDSNTGAHIQKTAAYVEIILEGLRRKGCYKEILTPQYIEDVINSAPLHDVGKISIPDAILNKPGKLTDEEFEIMKTHSSAGKEIINKAISSAEDENYLRTARDMAAYHHERWDGKGYPEGLRENEIPLSARIMAVADVFDALTSPRVYKPAFPLSKALTIIEEGKGTQFDADCVDALMESLPQVKAVLKKFNPDYQEE